MTMSIDGREHYNIAELHGKVYNHIESGNWSIVCADEGPTVMPVQGPDGLPYWDKEEVDNVLEHFDY